MAQDRPVYLRTLYRLHSLVVKIIQPAVKTRDVAAAEGTRQLLQTLKLSEMSVSRHRYDRVHTL